MAKRKNKGLPDAKDVLRVFKQKKKPLTRAEVRQGLGMKKQAKNHVRGLINELVDQGKIIHLKRGAFGLVEGMGQVTGRLEVQRSGVGFVIPDDKQRNDVFISPNNFGQAWHGDRVVIALLPGRTGKRAEGRVVRVLSRAVEVVPARVIKPIGYNVILCLPCDPKLRLNLSVDVTEMDAMPESGTILLIRPEEEVEQGLWTGAVQGVLGDEEDVAVQEAMVKLNHQVPTKFPEAALAEAANLPELPDQADFAGRKDLRDMDFVTIDGAKAKDFDDAIRVTREPGGFRLWVAIADVSHYVAPGSALDQEARERGNSYYFPQSVEPMFPERLSNGLCSLNPNQPRLAMVVETAYSADGVPGEYTVYPAVFESKARLTYAQVNRALLLDEAEERKNIAPVLPMLEQALALARAMAKRRKERGGLDFDLPEPEIQFNLYGETVDIRPRVSHFGHQLIEEFMIAANERVAEFLTERGLPCMYRVHQSPDPDRVAALFKLLSRTDLAADVPDTVTPQSIQALLKASEGTDLEFLVARLTLRTMMQAKYQPENIGHFGLASPCYCHFTSPIRRYADLLVHRAVKQALAQESGQAGLDPAQRLKNLKRIGEDLSVRERRAMEAEREILKRVTILFLRDKVGDEFTGLINSFSDFGFWVELNEVLAEGMVRLSTLTDDYYAVIPERQELVGERTGKRYTLGQTIRVRLTDVNLARLEVNLELKEDVRPMRGKKQRPKMAAEPPAGERAERAGGRGARPKKAGAKAGGKAGSRGRPRVRKRK